MYPRVWCLFLAAGLSLLGCGATQVRASIVVDADANSNTPVTIAAVLIYRTKLVTLLQEMTSAQWFQKREQLLRDNPKDLEEILWEFVPGQQIPAVNQKMRGRALQGILFANYRTPGAHRYLFDPKQPQEWVCGLREIRLQETNSRSASESVKENKATIDKVKDSDPR